MLKRANEVLCNNHRSVVLGDVPEFPDKAQNDRSLQPLASAENKVSFGDREVVESGEAMEKSLILRQVTVDEQPHANDVSSNSKPEIEPSVNIDSTEKSGELKEGASLKETYEWVMSNLENIKNRSRKFISDNEKMCDGSKEALESFKTMISNIKVLCVYKETHAVVEDKHVDGLLQTMKEILGVIKTNSDVCSCGELVTILEKFTQNEKVLCLFSNQKNIALGLRRDLEPFMNGEHGLPFIFWLSQNLMFGDPEKTENAEETENAEKMENAEETENLKSVCHKEFANVFRDKVKYVVDAEGSIVFLGKINRTKVEIFDARDIYFSPEKLILAYDAYQEAKEENNDIADIFEKFYGKVKKGSYTLFELMYLLCGDDKLHFKMILSKEVKDGIDTLEKLPDGSSGKKVWELLQNRANLTVDDDEAVAV
ncbi:MAG: hypothetical protein LBI61_02760 [Puniceicoccales bacterium]|jgi:hypothetical protein|nr:hypothetical protein [Puniceicoccales bacterium]